MAETTTKALLGHIALDKKRIRISSKRQITIPMKFHELLGMSDEVDLSDISSKLKVPSHSASRSFFIDIVMTNLYNLLAG